MENGPVHYVSWKCPLKYIELKVRKCPRLSSFEYIYTACKLTFLIR